MSLTSYPVARFAGQARAPGDKSCSHRAVMMAALADGRSNLTGLLEGDDVRATLAAAAALGAGAERVGDGAWRVDGAAWRDPAGPLDFGNSGTGCRLMLGALAGAGVTADLVGDDSLSRRPMGRVLNPLRLMGARTAPADADRLPLRLDSAPLNAIDYAPPEASAQVKSAILLAGLGAQGRTSVSEATPTRDHTERMLRGFGVELSVERRPGGAKRVSIQGGQRLQAVETAIPGDPSSAAFLAAAALISPHGEILLERVMSNDTRDGFYEMAAAMGGAIGAEPCGEAAGERLIDLSVASEALRGRVVPERLAPSMIDEFPILAVLAAFAEGETVVAGAAELRVKESDRIDAIVDMLRANGVEAEGRPDGFVVQGCAGPPPGGGLVETRRDHRIAMSALVMGSAAQAPVSIDDASMIATSYPAFLDDMRALGARIEPGRP